MALSLDDIATQISGSTQKRTSLDDIASKIGKSTGDKCYGRNQCGSYVKDRLGIKGTLGSLPKVSAKSMQPGDVLHLSKGGEHWAVVNPDGRTVSEWITPTKGQPYESSTRTVDSLRSRIAAVHRPGGTAKQPGPVRLIEPSGKVSYNSNDAPSAWSYGPVTVGAKNPSTSGLTGAPAKKPTAKPAKVTPAQYAKNVAKSVGEVAAGVPQFMGRAAVTAEQAIAPHLAQAAKPLQDRLAQEVKNRVPALAPVVDWAQQSSTPFTTAEMLRMPIDMAKSGYDSIATLPEQVRTGNIAPILNTGLMVAGGIHGVRGVLKGRAPVSTPSEGLHRLNAKELGVTPEMVADEMRRQGKSEAYIQEYYRRQGVTPTPKPGSVAPLAEAPDVLRMAEQAKSEARRSARKVVGKESPAVKEPWEMTKHEWNYQSDNPGGAISQMIKELRAEQDAFLRDRGIDGLEGAKQLPQEQIDALGREWAKVQDQYATHRAAVAQALRDGLPVPPEVLADYPDLAPKPTTAEPLATPQAPATETAPMGEQGISKARIAGKRESLGLQPVEVQPYRARDASYTEGKAAIDSGNLDIDRTAREVMDNPRPLTSVEAGGLQYRLDQIEDALPKASPEEQSRLVELRNTLHHAATRAGREWSTTGQAYQLHNTADEFSLGNILQTIRENADRPLTPVETKQYTGLWAEHERLKGEVEALRQRRVEVVRKTRVAKAPADLDSVRSFLAENTLISEQTVRAAEERLAAKGRRLNAGVDPTMISDLAIVIGGYVEAGVRFSYKTMHKYLSEKFGATDEEISRAYQQATNDKRLKAAKQRATQSMGELEQTMKTGRKPARAPAIRPDLELIRKREELGKARDAIRKAMAPKWGAQKAQAIAATVANAATGWKATLDNSFLGRQGWNMLFHNPRAWGKAFTASHKAMSREGSALLIDDAIAKNKHFPLARQSGLEYTSIDTGAPLASAEEVSMYMRTAEKLPVVGKVIEPILRPFDRAYTTAGNVMRHEAFYRMADLMGDKWTAQQYKDYAAFLNKMTGRGNLGRWGTFQPELNAIFISARNIAAQWQYPLTALKGEPAVRKIAATTMVKQAAALGTLAYVINASGLATVGLNPDSPDFMKIRVKGRDTRFDLLPGSAQTAVRAAWKVGKALVLHGRFAKQKPGPFTSTVSDVANQYLGNKMAPGVQLGKAAWTGKDFKGDSVTFGQATWDAIGPMPWNVGDIVDAWNQEGPVMASAVAAATFYGIGARTYKDSPRTVFEQDKATAEILKSNGVNVGYISRKLEGGGKSVELNKDDYEAYQAEMYQAVSDAVKQWAKDNETVTWPTDKARRDSLTRRISAARTPVRNRWKSKNKIPVTMPGFPAPRP